MTAPVILFVYNRLDHVRKTIEALAINTLAKDSELFIFSDGPKNEETIEGVLEVRRYINSDFVRNSFARVIIEESKHNMGLANSIINGVTKVIEKYGRVIVIEDDNVSSPDFLSYMNECLEFYKEDERIWSIGGFSFIKHFPKDYNQDVYLIGRTCSYAWATWKDRWSKVDWNVTDYYSNFRFNFKRRFKFNRHGNDRASMLDAQMYHQIDSWAIRFCYAEFVNNMFTVYPRVSKISNIGHDGSGTHFNRVSLSSIKNDPFNVQIDGQTHKCSLSHNVMPDKRIIRDFANSFNESRWRLLRRYIGSIIRFGT
ncbi:glycosyltransferase family A protein [Neobacillus sp. LXY-4]|uniref:glycosyltransferase family A protein n=1 Tax=Neobacillus sp. LXY-4 TaxID=3379826 RepID=UPI003EE29512